MEELHVVKHQELTKRKKQTADELKTIWLYQAKNTNKHPLHI